MGSNLLNLLGWHFEVELQWWIGMAWFGTRNKSLDGLSFSGWQSLVDFQLKTDYMLGGSQMIVTVCCVMGEWNRKAIWHEITLCVVVTPQCWT